MSLRKRRPDRSRLRLQLRALILISELLKGAGDFTCGRLVVISPPFGACHITLQPLHRLPRPSRALVLEGKATKPQLSSGARGVVTFERLAEKANLLNDRIQRAGAGWWHALAVGHGREGTGQNETECHLQLPLHWPPFQTAPDSIMSAPNSPVERWPHATPLKHLTAGAIAYQWAIAGSRLTRNAIRSRTVTPSTVAVATALRVAVLIRSPVTIPNVEAAPTPIVIAISVRVNVSETIRAQPSRNSQIAIIRNSQKAKDGRAAHL